MTNAEKIAAWRANNPTETLTAAQLCDLIGAPNLRNAYLRGANLRGADLQDAYLVGADLRGADLAYADLAYADLWGADLRSANLGGTDLWGADLRYANLPGILRVEGLPSGDVTPTPTPEGWHLTVGCWRGTPDDLRALIASDEGWPEARGEEVVRRRPLLAGALVLIDVHTADQAQVVTDLAERWDTAS